MKLSTSSFSLESRELLALGVALGPTDGAPAPPSRDTEFRAVQGGREMASGEVLLVEAYAGLWIILLAFLLINWRRQTRIDTRVAELERSLAQHGPK